MISLAFRLSEPGGTTGLTVDHSRANAMNLSMELSDAEIDELNAFLGRVKGGDIPNAEALDGFFAALACWRLADAAAAVLVCRAAALVAAVLVLTAAVAAFLAAFSAAV